MRSRRPPPPRASRPQRSGNYYRHDYYCPYYYPYYHYPYYWDYENDYDYEYDYDWGNDYDWEDYEVYEPYSELTARAYQKGLKQGMARARAMLAKKTDKGNEP